MPPYAADGAPAARPPKDGAGVVVAGSPASLGGAWPAMGGIGEGNPAGNCEVKPAGLGSGEASPDGLGKLETAGAVGWGTARIERLGAWASLTAAAPASKAKAHAARTAVGRVERAFTAAFLAKAQACRPCCHVCGAVRLGQGGNLRQMM